LIKHFLANSNIQIDPQDLDFQPYLEYHWPGNVRELKHEIEKLALSVANGEKLTPQLLSERIVKLKNGEDCKNPQSLHDEVTQFEKKRIKKALDQSGGNKSQAAKILGIPEATFWNKLKRHKIE
jgi:arginine utilization regulatory protein